MSRVGRPMWISGAAHLCGSTTSPVGLQGPPVVVVEAERVVLRRVAVGDLQDPARARSRVRDAVGLLGGHDELFPRLGLHVPVADLERDARIENDPHLVAELVVMDARLLPRLDGDHPDRGGLIERVGRDASPGFVDDHGDFSRFGSASRSEAISSAAIAASHPLLPCLPPARSRAWSNVSVVSTPNVTGTPFRSAASRMPRAASAATKSKCGVSPRITAPRQTTASYPPGAASRSATRGISNAPGVH